MKRIVLAILLALPTIGVANSVNSMDPIPDCLPCPPRPTKDVAPVVVVEVPADLR